MTIHSSPPAFNKFSIFFILLVIFFFASAVHIAKYAGCWYPDYNRDDDDCPYNVVSKEHQNSVDINVFYDVPETLHHILNCFFTLSLITEALDAWCAIWQDIHRRDREAGVIKCLPAAPFTCILNCVTHAALHILCLTVWKTVSLKTLPFLYTGCSILHWLSFGTFCLCTQTSGLIFTCGWLLLSTLNSLIHELTVLAARRIAITAFSLGSKFAVFVTTHIYIILAYKSCITLFLSLNPLVTTVRLFGFCEATGGLGHQYSADCSKTAWREPLIVYIIP